MHDGWMALRSAEIAYDINHKCVVGVAIFYMHGKRAQCLKLNAIKYVYFVISRRVTENFLRRLLYNFPVIPPNSRQIETTSVIPPITRMRLASCGAEKEVLLTDGFDGT